MFDIKICLATILLSLHTASSYILLTANLDDVHSLAKQIASSPVVNQINDIIRRAATNFNDHNVTDVRKHNSEYVHARSDPQLDEKPQVVRRQDLVKTGKNLPHPTKKGRSEAAAAYEKDDAEVWTPDKKAVSAELKAQMSDSSSDLSKETNDIRVKPLRTKHNMRRQGEADIAEMGRNASFYLTSIKKIFESV